MSDAVPFNDLDFEVFPAGFGRGRRLAVPVEQLVLETGPLTAEHIAIAQAHVESGAAIGVVNSELKAIRHTHHRLAQCLAGGMDETVAARLCNYSPSRVSILKSDPAFAELLAFYSGKVEEEFTDFVRVASGLGMDTLQELQKRLDEQPETFTNGHLMEMVKLTADRTGHAPVQKSVNVNVNADVGQRLNQARERLAMARAIGGHSETER